MGKQVPQARRRRRVRRIGWFAALAGTLLLAACGGSAAPASTAAPSSAGPASAAAAASASVAAKPATSTAASSAAKPAGSAAGSAAAKSSASAKPAASIAPAAPGAIILSYSEIVGVHATEWGAKEGGIFQKNGLNVDVRLIESSLGVGALLSGQVQIASMGGSEMLAADVNGGDLVAYATMSPVYPYVFEAVKSIKTPADLKGKKIGISRFGSSSDVATRAWLKSVGVDPSSVQFVQIGSLAARTAALKTGQLDGGMVSATTTKAVEDAGLHPLADLAAQKIPAVNDCVVASRAWVTANHDTMQKFVDSIMEAKAKEKADEPFTVDVFKKYLKITNPDELKANYDYYLKEVIPDAPYPTPEGFKDTLTTVAAQNPKAAGFDINKVIDSSFVKSAVDRGIGKS